MCLFKRCTERNIQRHTKEDSFQFKSDLDRDTAEGQHVFLLHEIRELQIRRVHRNTHCNK